MQLPDFPDLPAAQRGQGAVYVHYEDIAQDGSLKVGGMLPAIGLVAMGKLWFKTPLSNASRAQGIIPILTRLTMQGIGGPLSVRNKVEVEGAYQIGHTRDASGAVSRIVVNSYADLYGPVGRTHPPQPENAGERVHAGRVFAEHVFTRPFGPPDARKVHALPTPDGPLVPGPVLSFREAIATLDVGPATWLEPTLAVDPTPLTFGLTHTDSNQHVNSLVYPQLFEDAALRRLFDLGRDTRALLADVVDVAFRKPCFAGQRMFVWLRAFEQDGKLGAVAYLGPKDCPPERAHCVCALTFRDGERSGSSHA